MLPSRSFHLLAALSTALLLTACGGDDDDDDTGEGDRPSVRTLRSESGRSWGSPRFSPDGTRIAFLRAGEGIDGPYELAVMKEDGTDVRVLADNGTYLTNAAWSRDGSRIYYSGDEGIYSIPSTGGTPTLESDAFAAAGVDLSPDGRWLAYGTNGSGLHMLDLTTHTSEQLNEDGAAPAFSPDGTRLAYLSTWFTEQDEVRVLTLATQQSVLVASDGTYLSTSDWLPDGRLAAITEEGITLFDLTGATPLGRLVHDAVAAKELDVSPDGRKMAYAINGQSDLFVLTGY
ncbi:TolB family protein [Pyxidicoccus sp. 3LG]